METKEYAVIRITEYYDGDCQHPMGISGQIETRADEDSEIDMIGTLDECEEWESDLNDGNIYLSHGEASRYWIIAEIE